MKIPRKCHNQVIGHRYMFEMPGETNLLNTTMFLLRNKKKDKKHLRLSTKYASRNKLSQTYNQIFLKKQTKLAQAYNEIILKKETIPDLQPNTSQESNYPRLTSKYSWRNKLFQTYNQILPKKQTVPDILANLPKKQTNPVLQPDTHQEINCPRLWSNDSSRNKLSETYKQILLKKQTVPDLQPAAPQETKYTRLTAKYSSRSPLAESRPWWLSQMPVRLVIRSWVRAPSGSGNILIWRLIMNYFLRSFPSADSRRAGQFLMKEYAQVLVNHLED